jgi:antitoxin (DNA-binding transcriptional repressor) of toxin-antitoxin stability system
MRKEEVVVTEAGKPAAKLSAISAEKPKRYFGLLKGKIKIASDFDSPLSDDVIADFEGR